MEENSKQKVTAVCGMGTTAAFMPTSFIFPRKYQKLKLIGGALSSCSF